MNRDTQSQCSESAVCQSTSINAVTKRLSHFTNKLCDRALLAALILPVILFNSAAAQDSSQSAKGSYTADRPPPSEQSTDVLLGMYLNNVLSIDDSQQTMSIDLGISARWIDPRLADKAGELIPLDDAWNPRLELMANKDITLTKPKVLKVSEGGHVEYLQRYIGEIWHSSDLSRFPYDDQVFSIQILSPLHTPDEVNLIEDNRRTGQKKEWSLFGWKQSEGRWSNDPFYFSPSGETFAGASYSFPAQRKSGFYFWKVIVPISLVILMSCAAFWIDSSNAGSQISVATSAILALVAYRFVISNMVPHISYMTLLDRFILGASILVVCVLIESIWTGRLAAQGNVAKAIRIDRHSRYLFVLAYVFIVLVSFVY